jgi:WD40 repeat protein
VNSLAYSPDGAILAGGSADGAVRLWRVADGSLIRMMKGHVGAVLSVAFSPDGLLVGSGGVDGSVHLWQVSGDFSTSSQFGDSRGISTVSFNDDGLLLAFGSGDGRIRLLDVKSGKVVQTWNGDRGAVTALEFSPDDTLVASGSHDGDVVIRSIRDGQLLATLKNANGVASLAFNRDGSVLAVGALDGVVEIWAVPAATAPVPVVAPTQPAQTLLRVVMPPVAQACTDMATFVGDVTIPDNSAVVPGVQLDKTWRFRNTGTCAWGSGYRLAFVGGSALGAQPQRPIPLTPPGGVVDVTTVMFAPTAPGGYRGVWQLLNAAGAAFGPRATIAIQVPLPSVTAPAPSSLGITANSTNINAGDSVTIQASVQNVQAAWVNGQPVINNFFQETVQLCNSTTFVLTALLLDGSQPSQSVTVNVQGSCGGELYRAESLKRIEMPFRFPGLGESRALFDRFIGRGFVGAPVENRDRRPRPEPQRAP